MRNMIAATAVATACFTSATTHAADETTKVSGYAFIDLSTLNKTTTNKSSGVESDDIGNGVGLDVKRFYVGVDHVFDDTWSANITTDFQYSSAISSTEVFVKKAYLQARFNDAFVVRAGSTDMPWLSIMDALYGYRYVEKSVTDLEGVATTTDWGLHASGKFANGMISYAVSAVNGGGFKNPTRSKSVDFEGRVSVMPVNGLTLAAGVFTGKRGKETALDPAENTGTRYDFLAAYVVDQFRVGVEYYLSKNLNDVQQDSTGPVAPNGVIASAAIIDTDKESAISVWGAFNFTHNASFFVRYDSEKLNPSDTVATAHENTNKYLQAGVTCQPRKNIDLALAYKNTRTDTNFATTSSKIDEIGVWSQLRF